MQQNFDQAEPALQGSLQAQSSVQKKGVRLEQLRGSRLGSWEPSSCPQLQWASQVSKVCMPLLVCSPHKSKFTFIHF